MEWSSVKEIRLLASAKWHPSTQYWVCLTLLPLDNVCCVQKQPFPTHDLKHLTDPEREVPAILFIFTQIGTVGLTWPQLWSEPLMTLMTHFVCLHLFSSRDLSLHSTLAGTLLGAPAACGGWTRSGPCGQTDPTSWSFSSAIFLWVTLCRGKFISLFCTSAPTSVQWRKFLSCKTD